MLPCARRNEIQMHGRDGSMAIIHRCAHVDAERFTSTVTESDCAACVMRVPSNHTLPAMKFDGVKDFAEPTLNADGSITYPRTGWEPPRCPKGFERTDDPWTFRPLWAPCADRQLIGRKLSCGCIELDGVCGSKEGAKAGQLVVLTDCEACPVRQSLVKHADNLA